MQHITQLVQKLLVVAAVPAWQDTRKLIPVGSQVAEFPSSAFQVAVLFAVTQLGPEESHLGSANCRTGFKILPA